MAYVNGYGYGGTPYWQFIDANGNPLSNGTVATYIAGTTTAYNTLKDWNGTYNGVVFDLDIRGGCSMIWPTTQLIKIIVKDVDGNLFKTLDNIQASGSEGGYIPGTTVIRVDGTENEIISTGTADPDDPNKLIFTISLDPAITTQLNTNTSDIDGIQIHINNIETSITNINDTLDTLITGPKDARSFPLSLTNTRYIKICELTIPNSTTPYHIDFLLYLAKNQLSLKFDEDVGGGMGTGTGSFKYLGQSCNSAFVYDVTENHGRLVIFRTTPDVDNKVSFYLTSYNGYESLSETVSIIDGHASSAYEINASFSSDAYTETSPEMASNSETIYLTHNIRVGTSMTGLGTYYSPIECKPTQVTSDDESVAIVATLAGGVTTYDLSVQGGQIDTFKFKRGSDDDSPAGFFNEKVIAGNGIVFSEITENGIKKMQLNVGNAGGEISHISTGDALGASDNVSLQAGYFTQWSAHACIASSLGELTANITTSKMGFIASQVVTGNFILGIYKVETSLAHSLLASTGVNSFGSTAGWRSALITNVVATIQADELVMLVIFTNCNGVAIAGKNGSNLNFQPYISGIKTNMGILTEAPATLTLESETTNRPFIYLTK